MGATFTFVDLLEKLDGTPANWKSNFRKATLLRVRKSLAHHKTVVKKRSTLNVETKTKSRWVNRMLGPAGILFRISVPGFKILGSSSVSSGSASFPRSSSLALVPEELDGLLPRGNQLSQGEDYSFSFVTSTIGVSEVASTVTTIGWQQTSQSRRTVGEEGSCRSTVRPAHRSTGTGRRPCHSRSRQLLSLPSAPRAFYKIVPRMMSRTGATFRIVAL